MIRALARTTHIELWVEAGLSSDSSLLRSLLEKARQHADEPVSLGWKRRLYDQAMEIGGECSVARWDGYGGAPILGESVVKTLKLISQLPDSIQPPNLIPSPGGYISFEWHDPEKRVLSVSPKNNLLVWASVLGIDDTRYGRSPARMGWPQAVLDILTEYFTGGRSLT